MGYYLLATTVRGQFYYLYMFIFSRKIVGFEVYETQSDILALQLLRRYYILKNDFSQQSGAPF